MMYIFILIIDVKMLLIHKPSKHSIRQSNKTKSNISDRKSITANHLPYPPHIISLIKANAETAQTSR